MRTGSMMSHLPTPDIKIAQHFTILVYPFRHGLLGRKRSNQLKRLADRWQPWLSRLERGPDRDSLKRALDDTYFFLPYIRRLLFPETALLIVGDASAQMKKARQLTQQTSDELAEELYAKGVLPDGVLRLTYD